MGNLRLLKHIIDNWRAPELFRGPSEGWFVMAEGVPEQYWKSPEIYEQNQWRIAMAPNWGKRLTGIIPTDYSCRFHHKSKQLPESGQVRK